MFGNNVGRASNALREFNIAPGPMTSYQEKSSAELGVERYWKNRFLGNSLSMSYAYDKGYSRSLSRERQDYTSSSAVPGMVYERQLSSSSVQARHSLSIKGNLNDERLKQANFSLQGSLSSLSGSSVSSVSSMTADRIVSQRAVSDSRGRDRDVSGSVTWRNATTGTCWTPGVGLSFSYGNGGSHSLQVDTAASSTTRRILSADGDGTRYNYRVNPSLSYMLFNSEHLTASLSLGLLLSGSQRGKKTLA